jgi:S-layer homology domain
MVKGKIDTTSGTIKVINGTVVSNTVASSGLILDVNKGLDVPSRGSASIYFFGTNERNTKYRTQISGGSSKSTYKFPCQVTSGSTITSWENGKKSGCSQLVATINKNPNRNFLALETSPSVAQSAPSPPAVALATPLAASPQNAAIQELVDLKIMAGYPDGTTLDEKYRPKDPVTRAEFASLVSAANLYWQVPATNRTIEFDDMPDNHWASTAIARAVSTGFLLGYENKNNGRWRFQPDERIPRQQVLVALAGGLGLRININDIPSVLKRYQDADLIAADWARSPVAAATKAGLLIDSAPTLKPQQAITRGETAILISQALAYKVSLNNGSGNDLEVFAQPAPDPTDPPYLGPEVRVSPVTPEVTLVQIDASDEAGTIVVNSLTSTVKVIASATRNGAKTEALLQPGQRYLYRRREGNYEGFVTVIEMPERRSIINSSEMQSFLDDWVPEAEALPRAEYEKLFNDRFLRPTPLTQPDLNQAIVQAMNTLKNFSTLPFIAPIPGAKPGDNSCGWAVNQVLAQARIESLDTYVPRVKSLLETERGTKITDRTKVQAGDIVIAPVTKGTDGVGEPHMGICISPTIVRSASATGDKNTPPRQFVWETNLDFNGYFDKDAVGTKNSTIYRLKS